MRLVLSAGCEHSALDNPLVTLGGAAFPQWQAAKARFSISYRPQY